MTHVRHVVGLLLLLSGCAPESDLMKFRNLCESTGGIYMNCETAFALACGNPTVIGDRRVVCSCLDGKKWNSKKGCV